MCGVIGGYEMKLNQSKAKIGGLILAFFVVIGIMAISSSTAQAQWRRKTIRIVRIGIRTISETETIVAMKRKGEIVPSAMIVIARIVTGAMATTTATVIMGSMARTVVTVSMAATAVMATAVTVTTDPRLR